MYTFIIILYRIYYKYIYLYIYVIINLYIHIYIYIYILYKLVSANCIACVCYFMIADYNDIYIDIDIYRYLDI